MVLHPETGTMPSMVGFKAASKSFGDVAVLKEITFSVVEGEKLVIIGASGSGKTTILRCAMTLEELDSGVMEVDDICIDYGADQRQAVRRRASQSVRRRVGMVFQQFNLFPHMSAAENIALAPRHVRGLSRHEAFERAHELLSLVGLSAKASSRPHELSGGQQQRVAIARALAMEPKVLLFDEVTSALDPEMVGEVTKVIRRIATETLTTMLIVTHEMSFAAAIADRVMFIDEGRIVEIDTPDVIFGTPSNQRTRAFLRILSER